MRKVSSPLITNDDLAFILETEDVAQDIQDLLESMPSVMHPAVKETPIGQYPVMTRIL